MKGKNKTAHQKQTTVSKVKSIMVIRNGKRKMITDNRTVQEKILDFASA